MSSESQLMTFQQLKYTYYPLSSSIIFPNLYSNDIFMISELTSLLKQKNGLKSVELFHNIVSEYMRHYIFSISYGWILKKNKRELEFKNEQEVKMKFHNFKFLVEEQYITKSGLKVKKTKINLYQWLIENIQTFKNALKYPGVIQIRDVVFYPMPTLEHELHYSPLLIKQDEDDQLYYNSYIGLKHKPSYYIESYKNNRVLLDEFLDFLKKYVFDDNELSYSYFIDFFSEKYQYPQLIQQTSIVLKGLQGTFKGWTSKLFLEEFGDYATTIEFNRLQSKFNAIFENKLFVLIEEFKVKNDSKQDFLKLLVTSDTQIIESKNREAKPIFKYFSLLFNTNEDQPFKKSDSGKERRFKIFNLPSILNTNQELRAYWIERFKYFEEKNITHLLTGYLLSRDLNYMNRTCIRSISHSSMNYDMLTITQKYWYNRLKDGKNISLNYIDDLKDFRLLNEEDKEWYNILPMIDCYNQFKKITSSKIHEDLFWRDTRHCISTFELDFNGNTYFNGRAYIGMEDREECRKKFLNFTSIDVKRDTENCGSWKEDQVSVKKRRINTTHE